ncbi:hypothetical protein F4780DRAFT_634880 [Xylariomycetidae sp. FL0641]|nr:hypothetical protein F4780DRAFT_634880 [Xylariomycetidae sp. FL0641]
MAQYTLMKEDGKKTKGSAAWKKFLSLACVLGLLVSVFAVFNTIPGREVQIAQDSSRWRAVADVLMSRSSADALANDKILRRNWVALIELGADTADIWGSELDSESLKRAGESLALYHRELSSGEQVRRSLAKRQPGFLDKVGDFFGIGGDDDDSTGDSDNGTATDDGSSGVLGGIGDFFKDALGGIGDKITGDLAGAGMFLGVGVGEGAAQGLNITSAENAKAVGSRVLAASGMDNGGLNPTIENLGMGAAASLLGAVDLSSITGGGDTGGDDGGILASLGPAIMSLAAGVGTGALNGLNVATPAPPNGTDLTGIVGMFGFGLADSVAGSIDIGALTDSVSSGSDDSGGITEQLPAAVLKLAQGLGNGAVTGLKLNSVAPPSGTAVPDLAGAFGFGLSQSVTSNLDLSSLTGGEDGGAGVSARGLDISDLSQMLPAAASGLGKGLGQGIPVGLGLQQDPGVIPSQSTGDDLDVGGLAQNFAVGLSSRLLANDTISKVISMASGGGSDDGASGLTSGLNFQDIAGGLARGLLQGAADGINSLGGVQAVVEGKATAPAGSVVDTPLQFNDSVDGAAVGFGQGLGSQGVLVVQNLFGKVDLTTKKRDSVPVPGSEDHALLDPRQEPVAPSIVVGNGTTTFNISALINAEALSSISQKGIDVLTCRGVGGLGLILTSVLSGSSGGSGSSDDLDISQFKDLLPQGSIKFTNEGHNYAIDLQGVVGDVNQGFSAAASDIKINGNTVPAFIAFLILHVLIGVFAFFNILPLAIGLESTRNILIRIKMSHVLAKAPRWNNIIWMAIIAPSVILVLLFGALTMGNASHFRTAHGVFGLLAVITGIAAVPLHYIVKMRQAGDSSLPSQLHTVRNVVNQLFLLLSVVATLTGFADLSKISICFTQLVPFELSVSLGFGLANVVAVASAVCGLDGYLAFRERRGKKSGTNDDKQPVSAFEE